MQKKTTTTMSWQGKSANKSLLFSISVTCLVTGILLASIVAMRGEQNIFYMIIALAITIIGVYTFAFAMREEKPWTAL